MVKVVSGVWFATTRRIGTIFIQYGVGKWISIRPGESAASAIQLVRRIGISALMASESRTGRVRQSVITALTAITPTSHLSNNARLRLPHWFGLV